MSPETVRGLQYEPPQVTDFGSIARHTFHVGHTIKGGGTVWHCDTHNEQSGGSGVDFFSKDTCVGRE